ncbi:glycogen debranching protein GlgX [candidate division KSB1 bacterium]
MEYILIHRTDKKLSPGTDRPFGAVINKNGTNFVLYSKYAKEVYLLFFDTPDGEPTDIIRIENRTNNVWHVFVHGIKANQLYAYKVRGDYTPKEGIRFNENKLLVDPYAKSLTGKFKNTENLLLAYDVNSTEKDLKMDNRDNTHIVPKSIVIDDSFDWQNDKKPNIPLEELIIYEVHVKGFTAHQSSNVRNPGTYLGFIEKIPYLIELGINVVELLPIHEFYIQDTLINKGLAEYWGYNTIGFFAPESSYSTKSHLGCQVHEFKTLVRELHKAGIEVILDVVYNHSGEGNELGPTVCFKGIDNPTYYALKGNENQPYRYYVNDTGCGNTFNLENPVVMNLVLDSLRYWADVMHVDGYRFDLASILAHVQGIYSNKSAFFEAVSDDPVLKNVKMIAEPWDLTTYQVGNFPLGWSEWNGKFRDTVRKFLKGDKGQLRDLGWRLTGSADLYGDDGRAPFNSINFITCHDGFTLYDLFSYNQKHNEANLEDNRDGIDNNNSCNCGFEGNTEDNNIVTLRKQIIKNAICCLIFSLGTPMLLAGDEMMRTQNGNNNAYCQDNEINWINWDYAGKHSDIVDFNKKAIAFYKHYTILRCKRFCEGRDRDGDNVPDINWFGENLENPLWDNPQLGFLCYQLDGSEAPSELGNYHLFFIYNMETNSHKVKLPQYKEMTWYRVIDTSLKSGDDFLHLGQEIIIDPSDEYQANPRSVVVLLGK